MSRTRCILVTICALGFVLLPGDRPAGATPGEMFPIDIVLIADSSLLCVNHVDEQGRPWLITEIASIHPDLPPLPFEPGQEFRVTGSYCVDCVQTFCGTFTGFIFGANLLPNLDGDVTIDGYVNVEDILHVLGAWGACPEAQPCPADADHDGSVGVGDLLAVLAGWS